MTHQPLDIALLLRHIHLPEHQSGVASTRPFSVLKRLAKLGAQAQSHIVQGFFFFGRVYGGHLFL